MAGISAFTKITHHESLVTPDAMRVIQERDGGNNPQTSYTRGTDLSGSMEGAGGIGGLLARSAGFYCTNSTLTICITNESTTDLIFWIYSDAGTNVDGVAINAGTTGCFSFTAAAGVQYTVFGTDYRYRELYILDVFTASLEHHDADIGPGPEDYASSESGFALCPVTGNWPRHDFYHADANGNITALVDSTESLSASYRYDPFGNTISKSGIMSDANVYRFSSKELHVASGMYYYGYRFYDPSLQRWVNSDPSGEAGGLNLFSFAVNAPTDYFDRDGMGPAAEPPTKPKPVRPRIPPPQPPVSEPAPRRLPGTRPVPRSLPRPGSGAGCFWLIVLQEILSPPELGDATLLGHGIGAPEECPKEIDEVLPNGKRHCQFWCRDSGAKVDKYESECDTPAITWWPPPPYPPTRPDHP